MNNLIWQFCLQCRLQRCLLVLTVLSMQLWFDNKMFNSSRWLFWKYAYFFIQVDETVKASLQIVLENVDHNWNLVYEDGDLKVQFFWLSFYRFVEFGIVWFLINSSDLQYLLDFGMVYYTALKVCSLCLNRRMDNTPCMGQKKSFV